MLRVTLLGNLGADPEVRFTAKGTQILSFRVAVNQFRTGPDGERQENTEWFRIRASGRLSELSQRMQRGMKVLVAGRLDIGHYQSKEGETRTSFDVWADELQLLSPPRAGGPEGAEGMDVEAEGAEPALAGVSSVARGGQAANGNVRGRGASRSGGAPGGGPSAEDLEDLPF